LPFNLIHALSSLPIVPPELRDSEGKRDLFVMDQLAPGTIGELEAKGWRCKDVRLLTGASRVRGYLDGLALGTISKDRVDIDILEMEAKVSGMLGKHGAGDDKPSDLGEKTLEALLELGDSRFVPEGTLSSQSGNLNVPTPVKKAGRPKGSKNKTTLVREAASSDLAQVKEMLK
jgi:hypothetical protein